MGKKEKKPEPVKLTFSDFGYTAIFTFEAPVLFMDFTQ